MLFTCNYSTIEGQNLNHIVEANTFSQAETAFTQYAQALNGEVVLNSINKSESQLAVTGNTANATTLNSKSEHNRIGFNIDALKRQVHTTYSHKVIIFD